MALQNYVNNQGPVVGAPWLNQVDVFVNSLFAGATTATQALAALGIAGGVPQLACCRFVWVSTTSCQLIPYNGDQILINGVIQTIPAAGVTVTNGATASSSLYYAYAYMATATTMAVELVATVPATNTNGMPIKTGDASRTLVGQLYTTTGNLFADNAQNRTVLSYWNRRQSYLLSTGGLNASTASTTAIELNGNARVNFLGWADQTVFGQPTIAQVSNSVINGVTYASIAFNTTTAGSYSNLFYEGYAANSVASLAGQMAPFTPVTGLNYLTILGQVSAGTGTYTTIQIYGQIWI